ncbi:MAG: NapC/NirT family cytochrome c [Chloroflexota bacterium]
MTEESIKYRRGKLAFLMTAGAIGIVLLVISTYQLVEFTDSTAFCGRLCHGVMYPEYTAHQASPHSRVTCSQCHVGSGAGYLVKSKVSGVPLIIATVFNTYERPIPTPVHDLRPARETCEQCHRPERFAGDLVRVHTTYGIDETNTEKVDTRILRVGGGEAKIARDIHWHVAAKVWYVATDDKRQEIAWVGVEKPDTPPAEYIDPRPGFQVTTEKITTDKRLMDCMDCHNRATHIFSSPEELIDEAIAQGRINKTLPFIKREGLSALNPPSPSLEQAYNRIEKVKDFYRTSYPKVYQEKGAAIDKALAELKEIARLTTFPFMNVTWKSYFDNAGHIESPGCFRCHGKLVVKDGDQKGKTIDAGCNSCHSLQLPQVSGGAG